MMEATVFNIQKFSLHDGPGIRTVVFLKGCPLRCRWCANPESQRGAVETAPDGTVYGRTASVEDVWAEVAQDMPFYEESGGGMTLSGGEPLMQIDFALALLERAKAEGVHTAVETTGAVPPEAIARALPLVDLWLFDVKHHDSAAHERGTGVGNARILENLARILRAGADVVARIPVIPGFNDSPDDAAALAALLRRMGVQSADLLPFHQFGEKKYETLGMTYALAGIKALRPEALEPYRQEFLRQGIDARV